jgi:hypothetical protein
MLEVVDRDRFDFEMGAGKLKREIIPQIFLKRGKPTKATRNILIRSTSR